MAKDDVYSVTAVRYATRVAPRKDFFVDPPPNPDEPQRLDYFVWALTNEARTVVVDTGFRADVAARRKREYLRTPEEGLRLVGVDVAEVEDVVISHGHYDHIGTISDFPKARIHLQEKDLRFIAGPGVVEHPSGESYELTDALALMEVLYDRRLAVHDGDFELAPGISLIFVGGHTPGHQAVRVNTPRGHIVLACDASHFYENMETGRLFRNTMDREAALLGFERMKSLADSPQHLVAGHDPLMMERYPAPSPELQGIAVSVDVAPSA